MRTWRNEEQIAEKWKERHHTRLGSSAVLISPSKGNEKKEVITTRGIRNWSLIQAGANATEQGLTLLSGRDVMLSLWYSDSQLKNGSDDFDATDLRL